MKKIKACIAMLAFFSGIYSGLVNADSGWACYGNCRFPDPGQGYAIATDAIQFGGARIQLQGVTAIPGCASSPAPESKGEYAIDLRGQSSYADTQAAEAAYSLYLAALMSGNDNLAIWVDSSVQLDGSCVVKRMALIN